MASTTPSRRSSALPGERTDVGKKGQTLLYNAGKYEYLNVTTGCSAATDFFTVGPNGMLRVCNHSPVELVKWDEWEKLPECEEWMHYVRHDYLPEMCAGCARAGACMGGCREAARVFRGSPTAPDPLMAG